MHAIGIDIGTTYSLVATVDESGKPVILRNSEGSSSTPSVIYFPEKGDPIVGRRAKKMQEDGEMPVAAFFKTNMGKKNVEMDIRRHKMSPTDFSAILLRKLVEDASRGVGERIKKAVITIPAYFEDAERTATLQAAKEAGIEVLRLIHEPTAAALSVGMDVLRKHGNVFLVYDLGGGTFDASVVELIGDSIEVRATGGNHELGGKDWDERLLNYVRSEFESEFAFDPADDMDSLGELRVLCETAKKDLSAALEVRVKFRTKSGVKADVAVSRSVFEALTDDLLGTTKQVVDACLRSYAEKCRTNGWNTPKIRNLPSRIETVDSKTLWNLVDQVLLVGGSTRMPMVTDYIRASTGREPIRCLNPDEAVALGAALQAAVEIQRKEGDGSLKLLPAFSSVVDNALVAHPVRRLELPVLCDITAHTMGMIAENASRTKYINSKILPKNSPIPNTERKIHELLTDGKRPMEVFVTQGESDDWFQCNVIRKYEFSGIAAPTNGVARIEVSYTYNENGIVEASARQLSPNRELKCKEFPAPEEAELARFYKKPTDNDPPRPVLKPQGAVVLAIDTSGSMTYRNAIESAKRAAIEDFVEKIPKEFTVGVVTFDNHARVVCQGETSRRRIRNAIQAIHIDGNPGTAANPFDYAESILSCEQGKKYVVVLSDGQWFERCQPTVLNGASRIKRQGVTVFAIGFGEADDMFLRNLASSSANAIRTDMTRLGQAYSTIARVVSGN